MALTLMAGIITLSVLIIVHELGHFTFAKIFHVRVEEFGIGFPPRIWGKKFGETTYSINWIPFGGFNKLTGEEDPSDPRSLAAQGYIPRFLVMFGGILFNLLLPIILLSVALMVPHDVASGTIEVMEVTVDSPAEAAGIVPGDIIVSIDGRELAHSGYLSRAIQMNLGSKIDIELLRADGTIAVVTAIPRWRPPEGAGSLGVLTNTTNLVVARESLPFWEAIPTGVVNLWDSLLLYKNGIIGMVIGTVPFTPAGPIGIVQATAETASYGISPLLELAAFISIAIGITQLLPFPALDGGRILFVFIQWVRRGRRVSPKVEGFIHSIGFIVLLGLLVLITWQDILRWVRGESLLG